MATIAKIKKGDTVIMCAFTGMKLGVKEVVEVDKSTITIKTDKGEATFDKKTLKQIDPKPKAPRFANSIIEDDGSYVPPTRKKKAKKAATKKKAEPVEVEEEDEETPAPKKAAKKKPAPKKKPEPQPEPEEDDEDEDEEWDDDDFEEVE